MALASLLSHCETLTHNERMKHLMLLGRSSTTNATAKSLTQELCNGDTYEQLLGLQTCHGSRDVAPLVGALQSPSAILRKRAANYLVAIGSDKDVVGALEVLHGQEHNSLLKRLRRRGRFPAVDAYLLDLEFSGDAEDRAVFRTFFPWASADLVALRLPELMDTLGQVAWVQLALYHPVLTFTIIRDRITEDGGLDDTLLSAINTLLRHTRPVGACGPAFWELVMDLVRELPFSVLVSKLELRELVVRRPQDVAQFVIDRGEDNFPSFSGVFSKLDAEQLLALQRLNQRTVSSHQFAALTADQRLAIYGFMGIKWRQPDGILPLNVFYGLPTKEKVREARRNIALPIFEARPSGRIPYIAALPWEEAMPLQRQFIASNDVNTRASAITKQVEAAGVQPDHLGDVLVLLLPRGREQDPVRVQFLSALSGLPAEKWETTHLEALTKIIRDALDASDLSYYSTDAILKLAERLLPFHTKWASGQLALIIGQTNQVPGEIQLKKPPQSIEIMKMLSHDLQPVLENLQKQDKHQQLIRLAEVLKGNLDYYPAFVEMIEDDVLMQTKSTNDATRILNLWSTYRPKRLEPLVPRLLDNDPSWITLHFIDGYVHEHSLTAYLNLDPLKGRFGTVTSSSRASYEQDEKQHFAWQETRQQQVAEQVRLVATVADETKSAHDWQLAIAQLARLCFLPADVLIAFAAADNHRPVVRDSSLRALARLDGGKGIPTLIEALADDERSRVAIYALRATLTKMYAVDALRILRNAPLTKVTVAKEVIRLAGSLETDAAHAFLLSLDDPSSSSSRPLHRDVLIALLTVIAPLLSNPSSPHHPSALALYTRAAAHPDPTVPTTILLRLPESLHLPHALDFWTPLLIALLSHPAFPVRHNTLKRCTRSYSDATAPSPPLLFPVLEPLLRSLVPEEPMAAAAAIMRVYGPRSPEVVEKVFTPHLAADLPHVARLLATYCAVACPDRHTFFPSTARLLTQLACAKNTLSLRLTLIFDAVPTLHLAEHVLRIGTQLHADALVKAEGLAQGLVGRGGDDLDGDEKEGPVRWLEGMERVLGSSGDERVRRLGLAVLVGMAGGGRKRGVEEGWSEGRRMRLEVYRGDGAELVAEAAAFVVVLERGVE